MQSSTVTFKHWLVVSYKVKHTLPYNSSIPLSIDSREIQAYVNTKTSMLIFRAALDIIITNQKHLKPETSHIL